MQSYLRGGTLGIDPGSRRIGVAFCDDQTGIAMPLSVIAADEGTHIEQIVGLAKQHNAAEVVVGLPKQMDGAEGLAASNARALAGELQQRLEVPVRLFDERLTTVSAHQTLRRSGVKGRRQRAVVDKVAATILLQAYIDAQQGNS